MKTKKDTKKTTELKPSTSILQSYLMWVGADHYADIKAYSDEAVALGISKRVPTADMAEKLAAPGTVVFLAHDEGEYKECEACVGVIDCPECRKRTIESQKLGEELVDAVAKKQAKVAGRLTARIAALETECLECKLCGGEGEYKAGTGGYVMVDGDQWDYRKYNYWLHQPKAWTPADHKVEDHMCEACGGRGVLPEGKVFGIFVPSAIEWIMPEGSDETIAKEMEARGFKVVPEAVAIGEPKRGCGKRHAGGCYVVTKAGESGDAAKKLLAEMIKSGIIKPKGAELAGNFIRFLSPVPIEAKRFRGLKRWSLDPRAEREAEMILDAVAG